MEKEHPSEGRLQNLFQAVAQDLPRRRRLPVSTYRLQLHSRFTFNDARAVLPYLKDLGVTDLYTSPYFRARKGSVHGYDVLDHNQLNPEIGSEEEYARFISDLQRLGMGHILDIVPNHMSILGDENRWWMDVLENGPSSPYADFFDIDWKPVEQELNNKVLLPILGDQYGQVLENGELNLRFAGGAFTVTYGEQKLPLDPASYERILKFRLDELEAKLGKDSPPLQELLSITTAVEHLPPQTERAPEKIQERQREKEVIKRRLARLAEESVEVRSFLEERLRIFNGEKGKPESFAPLDELLRVQAYRLSHWRVATEEINYRRFFNINELAAIRMERPEVFREAHRLTFRLVREKKVTGLRVDHPDGLYNPREYFCRLQKGCFARLCLQAREEESPPGEEGPPREENLEEAGVQEIERLYEEELRRNPVSPLRTPFFVVGEKILMRNERVPEEWPIFGTIGYTYLNPVNGIFVAGENAKSFDRLYARFIRTRLNYADLVYEKKKLIMLTSMAGEVNTLGYVLDRLSEKDRHTRDFTLNSLRAVLMECIAAFPVYRTYVDERGVSERDRRYIEQAVARARRKNPAVSATTFDFLARVLLLQFPKDFPEAEKAEWLDFVMKFQQVTAPVMAKGLEDTVFYVYNRLVSLNEVGGNPEKFGTSLEAFHGQNIELLKSWPYGLLATSTHDTKRSEDVRARMNVLSEIPREWSKSLFRWSQMNRKQKRKIEGQEAPDRNEEYLLYQTLLGIWPLDPGQSLGEEFRKRIREYMLKAVREAKVNTSWISPNGPYEEALLKFIDGLLASRAFLEDFQGLARKAAHFGMLNSLAMVLLKITSPGTPDFYQGTEIWDFSLVDPDNRRPVDFALRSRMLETLRARAEQEPRAALARALLREWRDGSIKLYLTFCALDFRRRNAPLLQQGAYLPLASGGKLGEEICAFARHIKGEAALTIVPRFLTRLAASPEELFFRGGPWAESWLELPGEISGASFTNIFTGESLRPAEREGKSILPLDGLLANFPVALLKKD